MMTSNALLIAAEHALKASREWMQPCADNTNARRDLRLIDNVLAAIASHHQNPDLSTDNLIDLEALKIVQDICPRLRITHPQQVAKIQVAIIDAIKISQKDS